MPQRGLAQGRCVLLGWMIATLLLCLLDGCWGMSVTAFDESSLSASWLRGKSTLDKESTIMIRCRLVQVEAFILPGNDETAEELSHTLHSCQTADGLLYSVEFGDHADMSRVSRPEWIAVPTAWIKDNQHGNSRRRQAIIVLPPGFMKLSRSQRSLNGQEIPNSGIESSREDVAPEDFTRIGRKTLLAVRVLTSTEEPDVGMDEMEASIFGTIPHPHATAVTLEQSQENVTESLDGPYEYQSVAEQYQAATLGNLIYEPLVGPGYENGILELNLADRLGNDFVLAGQGIQSLAQDILAATAERLGVSEVTNAADHVIFCLPNDALLAGTTVWTAFTYLYEPYSYYQRSRCTKLSVVMHELGHSLGFRHSGIPTNAYADETGPMGYSVNQYGAPVKAFNSHKNWIAGWLQHYAVHLRRLNDVSVASKTTYVGRVAALADAPHVPVGKEVVLLSLGRRLFLQYNRAKGFHRQTGTPNTVTIVYAEHEEDASTRVASLQVGDVYEYDGYPRLGDPPEDSTEPDENLGLVVALCRMGVDTSGETPIDYAELVVQWRDPNGPRAENLNLALCNIRNDESAPVLNFGVALENDSSGSSDARDTTLAVQSTNSGKSTVLLILGIIMATVGVACLAASVYLLLKQCRMQQQQDEVERQRESHQSSDDSMEKYGHSLPARPESFETAQTRSFDSWSQEPSPVVVGNEELALEVTEEQEIVEPTPVEAPRKREWWEDVVENLRRLAFSEEAAAYPTFSSR